MVRKNLQNAYPSKSLAELQKIERDFYRHLADTGVETLKLLTIKEKDLLKRVSIDSSVVRRYAVQGKPIFGMTSHFCNWEWLLVACTNQLGVELHAVYQWLRNPFFDKLMLKIRGRFGAVMHEKDEVVRNIMKMGNYPYLMSMVADQRPFKGENKYWSVFLNQDAAFYNGTELLARRRDILVVYASMRRVKRGYYEVSFIEITDTPVETKPGEITEKFIELAERDINADPASYLWSHDRWKHKKPKAQY